MINTIIRAISKALHAEFDDSYMIYIEDVRQRLQTPCFFVSVLNPSQERFLGRRFFRSNRFCVNYFPADPLKAKEECNAVTERLNVCLEWLPVPSCLPLRGTQMHAEFSDGVLSFYVNYDAFTYRNPTGEHVMERMDSNLTAKGES